MEIRDKDFAYMVEGKYGGAVAEQARDILAGEALDEQNPNALKEIAELAARYKPDLAEEINAFLAKGEK